MKTATKKHSHLAKTARLWNDKLGEFPAGTPVRYWIGKLEGLGSTGVALDVTCVDKTVCIWIRPDEGNRGLTRIPESRVEKI